MKSKKEHLFYYAFYGVFLKEKMVKAVKKHYIKEIRENSIAEEMEIEAGDFLLTVNDTEITDVLDYKYQMFDEYVKVLIEKSNGEQWDLEIEKDENEDIGLIFEEELMDKPRRCANHCIFCFMDQLPSKVRETLIFKDDDFRLSFMTGNYVTLTNASYRDLDRIIQYHLSPINISVHATNSEVRKMMLNNRNADKILEYIRYLTDHQISVNAQIVLCPNINDGEILDQTIEELSQFYPYVQCIAIVPVGLGKYRDGLYEIEPFNKESANKAINQVEGWQKKLKKKFGSNLVYIADEVYIVAEREIPSYETYEDFPQLEDGIGMIAKFQREFDTKYLRLREREINKTISIATGKSAYMFIRNLADKLEIKFKGLKVNVFAIENNFFGPRITVSGLVTGGDIIDQLKGQELGKYLLINYNMLKNDAEIFLDDITIDDVKNELQIKIKITDGTGQDFIDKIIK